MFKNLILKFFKKPQSPPPIQIPEGINPQSVFRGYFDQLRIENDHLTVQGWMLNWQSVYESIHYYINGQHYGQADMLERPDVAARLPNIKNSLYCGFRFEIPVAELPQNEIFTLRVSGIADGKETGQIETAFATDVFTRLPAPPVDLIQRVDELDSGEFYLIKGIQNFNEFWQLLNQYANPGEIDTLLDWGCGSGRLAGFFIEYSPIPNIYGCDIDAEATGWASHNLPEGHFTSVDPYPPTPYQDNQFNAVTAFSVFTHLSADNQRAWLEEMFRVLKPGGVLIATLHGMTAARTILQPQQIETLMQQGIYDSGHDARLAGVAPEEYYRSTFQTAEYTKKNWGDLFEVLAHVEHGASHYHDIIVLRRRKTPLTEQPQF